MKKKNPFFDLLQELHKRDDVGPNSKEMIKQCLDREKSETKKIEKNDKFSSWCIIREPSSLKLEIMDFHDEKRRDMIIFDRFLEKERKKLNSTDLTQNEKNEFEKNKRTFNEEYKDKTIQKMRDNCISELYVSFWLDKGEGKVMSSKFIQELVRRKRYSYTCHLQIKNPKKTSVQIQITPNIKEKKKNEECSFPISLNDIRFSTRSYHYFVPCEIEIPSFHEREKGTIFHTVYCLALIDNGAVNSFGKIEQFKEALKVKIENSTQGLERRCNIRLVKYIDDDKKKGEEFSTEKKECNFWFRKKKCFQFEDDQERLECQIKKIKKGTECYINLGYTDLLKFQDVPIIYLGNDFLGQFSIFQKPHDCTIYKMEEFLDKFSEKIRDELKGKHPKMYFFDEKEEKMIILPEKKIENKKIKKRESKMPIRSEIESLINKESKKMSEEELFAIITDVEPLIEKIRKENEKIHKENELTIKNLKMKKKIFVSRLLDVNPSLGTVLKLIT